MKDHAHTTSGTRPRLHSAVPAGSLTAAEVSCQKCVSGNAAEAMRCYPISPGHQSWAAFWGDTFGLLTDTFGVHWMLNITT
jgi:hypothetical protein